MNPPAFSLTIFLTLLLILAASSATFFILIRRATTYWPWVQLQEWAKEHGFRLRRDGSLPPIFSSMPDPQPKVLAKLTSGHLRLIQLQSDAPGQLPPTRWHLLLRDIPAHWPTTALRPTVIPHSLFDLLNLTPFPNLLVSDRYTVLGADPSAARRLARSPLRALLPADIGLLLSGHQLLLDFSARPFDTIEFERILAMVEPLTSRLPSLTTDKT